MKVVLVHFTSSLRVRKVWGKKQMISKSDKTGRNSTVWVEHFIKCMQNDTIIPAWFTESISSRRHVLLIHVLGTQGLQSKKPVRDPGIIATMLLNMNVGPSLSNLFLQYKTPKRPDKQELQSYIIMVVIKLAQGHQIACNALQTCRLMHSCAILMMFFNYLITYNHHQSNRQHNGNWIC